MPYNVQTKNRFQLASDSDSSEDEGIQNMDPSLIIEKATKEAAVKAKANAKMQVEQQRKEKLEAQAALQANERKQEEAAKNQAARGQGNNRGAGGRGGRGGNRGGRGGRGGGRGGDREAVERRPRRNNEGENAEGQAMPGNDNRRANNRNRDRNPRNNRPKTGEQDPNWGKIEDQPEAGKEEKKEVKEPEAAENNEAAEGDDGKAADEAVEEEPKEVTLSLDEYYAQVKAEVGEKKAAAVRKANDGQEIKGKALNKKKTFNPDPVVPKQAAIQRTKNNLLEGNFISDSGRGARNDRGGRGGRGGNRNNNRDNNRNNNRDNNRNKAPVNIADTQAFPTLGK